MPGRLAFEMNRFYFSKRNLALRCLRVTIETFKKEIATAVKAFDKYIVSLEKSPEELRLPRSVMAEGARRLRELCPGMRHGLALDKQVTIILSQRHRAPAEWHLFQFNCPYQKNALPGTVKAVEEIFRGKIESLVPDFNRSCGLRRKSNQQPYWIPLRPVIFTSPTLSPCRKTNRVDPAPASCLENPTRQSAPPPLLKEVATPPTNPGFSGVTIDGVLRRRLSVAAGLSGVSLDAVCCRRRLGCIFPEQATAFIIITADQRLLRGRSKAGAQARVNSFL